MFWGMQNESIQLASHIVAKGSWKIAKRKPQFFNCSCKLSKAETYNLYSWISWGIAKISFLGGGILWCLAAKQDLQGENEKLEETLRDSIEEWKKLKETVEEGKKEMGITNFDCSIAYPTVPEQD